ncbi:hypothetical protein F5B21DRAFT_168072 [Xylaria acuta]|nr:hypothetical protein F5B21DRAFT_168072 [Xylaria acuta]
MPVVSLWQESEYDESSRHTYVLISNNREIVERISLIATDLVIAQVVVRDKSMMYTRSRTRRDYTVGWVCARPKELTAAIAMLDQRHADLPVSRLPNDHNTYTLGSIGNHNIAIACLPKGKIGTVSAAAVATQMANSFPDIEFALMVGIGGGIPLKVRLGDVVVGTPTDQYPGVVQWDLGKEAAGSKFRRTGSWNNPPRLLLSAVSKLISEHDLGRSKMSAYMDEMVLKYPLLASKYLKSDSLVDVRFKAKYEHRNNNGGYATPDGVEAHPAEEDEEDEEEEEGGGAEICRYCDKTQVVDRKPRDMRVHYGLIASGNNVVENATFRDKLRQDLGGDVLCVETVAAGLMDNFPCVVVRGICDYADSHDNKAWQEHAAAIAAAFAKELLGYVSPIDIGRGGTAGDTLDSMSSTLSPSNENLIGKKPRLAGKEDLETLDWLVSTDYGPRQADLLGEREPGTGQWLLNSNEYRQWKQGLHKTLFCRGDPGSGKTILAAMIVNDLESELGQDTTDAVSYVYCNYKRQDEQTAEHLLSSLLKQLAQNQPSLPESVKQLYDQHKGKHTRLSIDEISRALESVTGQCSRVYIVVDALDECQASDNCRTRFLSAIFGLQAKTGVNILVTSRSKPEIVSQFKGMASIEIRAPDDDIRRYLRSRISKLRDFFVNRPDLQHAITTSITKAVNGTFLLAQLYLASLVGKQTPKVLREALQELETRSRSHDTIGKQTLQYDMAYNHAMAQIEEGQLQNVAKRAKQVLSWIACAKRPLTKLELQHALAVEINELRMDKDNIREVADLVSVCAGLVIVDEQSSIVRLVHYTAQDYFVRNQGKWFPDAQLDIAITCTTYLSYKDFETGCAKSDVEFKKRLQSHPLYDYAAQHWAYHCRGTPTHQKILSFLGKLPQVGAASQAARNAGYLSYSNTPKRPTGLHLAVYFGLDKVIRSVIGEHVVGGVESYGCTVLWWAAGDGQKAVVELLLTPEGIDPNSKDTRSGWTPLWSAVDTENEVFVALLLAAERVNRNVGDDDGWTPLRLAVREEDEALVGQLLATEGVDPNSKHRFGWMLLHKAVQNKNGALVRLLLATERVNPNVEDNHGWTPLHEGVQNRNEAVVELLLATKGVDPNLRNNNGCTPLMLAADIGNEVAVRMLLEAGADIDIVDKSGRTALQHAILFQQPRVEVLLLEYRAFRPHGFYSLQQLFSEESE